MHFSNFYSCSVRETIHSNPSEVRRRIYDYQKQTSMNYLVANFLLKGMVRPVSIECYSSMIRLILLLDSGVENVHILQFPRLVVTKLTILFYFSDINFIELIFLLFLFCVSRSPVLQSHTNILPSLLHMVTKYCESGENAT
jgi:hypothetical protein